MMMKNTIEGLIDSGWRRSRWLWAALTVPALLACFGGEGASGSAQTVAVLSVTPVKAAVGEATKFTVSGMNLPLTATLSLADGYCLTPADNTANGFTVVCTPGGAAGSQVMTVRSDTVANGGWFVGTQTITAAPATVTPLVYAVPVQLIAYHTAVAMGTDVDQPRNLAKSVTVE